MVNFSYNPHKNIISSHSEVISRTMDIHSINYDNFIFFGDFNADVSDKAMLDFCESYNLKSLIKQPIRFKNSENPSCIDLFLTNRPRSFCNSYVIETGLSDFYMMTVSVTKMHYKKLPPKIINYRDYKKFSNGNFLNSVKKVFSNKTPNEENGGIDFFLSTCSNVLNKHAYSKKKSIRGNQRPFMNKHISKEIMKRSKLRTRNNTETCVYPLYEKKNQNISQI